MKKIDQSSIIICSIVRNAEKGLKRNIPVIQEFCKYFANYRVIVYENDSTDNTKKILAEWVDSDSEHIVALMNILGAGKTIPSQNNVTVNPFFSRNRIEKMACLRNQYMKYIDDHKLEADYLMVVDLDVAQLYLEPILSSFAPTAPNWDVVTAYGYSLSPTLKCRYHDTYALTELGKENVPQTEADILGNANHFAGLLKNIDWIPVYSAFGGLSIYRFDMVKGLRYQVLDNNDPRVEVHCEHYSLCMQMRKRGASRIFINSQMKLKYQAVSFNLVWNTLKRKLL